MMSAYRSINTVIKTDFLVALLAIICMPVSAQLDADAMHNSVVRVVIDSGSEVGVASGFIWKEKNLVITSLHAVRPKPAKITVECRDIPYKATVHKFLRDADLVLLKTDAEMEHCSPLSKIRPKSKKLDGKTPLTAFGFKPDVTASTTKDLRRGSASSNKLRDLITGDLVLPMQTLNLPSIDLEVHFVTGGIYKGYSGGPVFDDKGDLVGIVEGGLDKGMSDHNWLIPAENIVRLLGSPPREDAPADLDDAAYYYSVVRSKRTSPENYIEFEDSGNSYRWIKTKTRSFEQLRKTSDPAEGLEDLWATLLPEVETSAEGKLQFNIYEEEELGLVIAVPAGRPLVYVPEDEDWSLVASDSSEQQAVITIQHGRYQFEDANGDAIDPSHDDFFESAVDEDLKECEKSELTCSLQDEHFRLVDFGAGNKILRVGYRIEDSDGDSIYLYKSLVVKGDNVLVVETILNLGEDSSVLKCFGESSAENCGESFWGAASFMLAAALTSFSNLGVEGIEPVVITPFDYDCENCEEDSADIIQDQAQEESYYSEAVSAPVEATPDRDTAPVTYFFESGEIAFHQAEGSAWLIDVNGTPVDATELRREPWTDEKTYAILQYGTSSYAVPIAGGDYYTAVAGGEWVQALAVYPLTVSYYFESGEIAFQHIEGSAWRIDVNGAPVEATELRREPWTDGNTYAILQYGTSSYAVPITGGQYYTAVAGGSWTPARVVQIQ